MVSDNKNPASGKISAESAENYKDSAKTGTLPKAVQDNLVQDHSRIWTMIGGSMILGGFAVIWTTEQFSFAISVIHDVNGNGKLDTNLFRIPKEPYGFTNNAGTTFGPPKFEAAAIVFNSNEQSVEIRLK